MTESSLVTTHPQPNQYPVTSVPSLASPLPNGSLSDTNNNNQEEEEYTIKCICIYADDDGNTVYCPKCDTWQHIECYYHGKKVPEEHFCADCFPRDLDAKKATERQRRHRDALDGGDRKVKRPSSKTQKKKNTKDLSAAAEQVNGWHAHDRHDSVASAREGPPTKKPKTNHRTSASVASINGDSRKRAASTGQSYPSPSKSPQDLFRFPAIPTYTPEFLELYERDAGNTNARDNEQTIQAANKLSTWRTDPSLLVTSPGQQPTAKSPFVRAHQSLHPTDWPPTSVETVTKPDVEIDGRCPTWRFLRIQTSVKKDDIVGEVRGQVGMLEEYCQQKSSNNRWQELRHPDPFVFFHPHMDIYIDSRTSGTRFRYLRRSCRPNVTLKTFVSDDDETHHCFVASKDIPSGAELTTTWFLDSGMFSVDAVRDDSEQAQSRRLDWVSRVLANFGDCACDSGAACLLAPFDRRFPTKNADGTAPKEKSGRKKKSKTKPAISPLGTGRATNSRAGSEPKLLDDDDHLDHRSTPDSSRSGGHSRDITPITVAALDADPVLGTGLTARELRKIQMAEKAFAQREQERKEPGGQGLQRKKKRTSGGSTLNTPNAATNSASKPPAQLLAFAAGGPARTLPEPSLGSPTPPRGPLGRTKSSEASLKTSTKPARPTYVSVSIQTDLEESELPSPPAKRRKFCTPTQRLLRRLLADRGRQEPQSPTPSSMAPGATCATGGTSIGAGDVEMKDSVSDNHEGATAPISPLNHMDDRGSPNVGTTTYPLPSQAAHTLAALRPPAPRLQLSTLPPVPSFPATTVAPATTSAAINAATASPLPPALTSVPLHASSVVTPSPVRKKLSLGDYLSRRLASTPSSEKPPSQLGLGVTEADLVPKDSVEQGQSSPAVPDTPGAHLGTPGVDVPPPATTADDHARNVVNDAAVKDEPDGAEAPPAVSSIPTMAPANDAAATDGPAAGNIPTEVTKVLSQLARLQES